MVLAHDLSCSCLFFFFFNDTATTEIYTLSLHDALPISGSISPAGERISRAGGSASPATPSWCSARERPSSPPGTGCRRRSEEHTSELQSRLHLVCRLLLEKKKKKKIK